MFNFYETLLDCLKGVNNVGVEVPSTTRFAAAAILAKMLADKDLFGIHDAIMKEGVLTHLSRGLMDKLSSVRKECATIIIQLQKFVDAKVEIFKPLVNPLITALGDEDESLVVRVLQCLKMLATNELIRTYIITNGGVSILCTFLIQNPKDVNSEILKEALSTLLSLQAS